MRGLGWSEGAECRSGYWSVQKLGKTEKNGGKTKEK